MALVVVFAGPVLAQGRVTRATHPWGSFGPQSSSLVRKITETFDEQGKLTNTTVAEIKTTLLAVEEDSYRLKVESTVEISGKKIVLEPRELRQTYEDLPADLNVAVKVLAGEHVLDVEDQRINCQVYEISHNSTLQKTTVKSFYCPKVAPFLLRRETTTTNATTGQLESQTVQAVVSLDMPARVVSENKPAAHYRIVQKHTMGTVNTLLIHCPEVPGGVVSQTSKETDAQGRVIRRTTVELVDYSVKPASPMVRQTSLENSPWRRRGRMRHRHAVQDRGLVVYQVGCR